MKRIVAWWLILLSFSSLASEFSDGTICGQSIASAVTLEVESTALRAEQWFMGGQVQLLSSSPALVISGMMMIQQFVGGQNVRVELVAPDEKNRMVVASVLYSFGGEEAEAGSAHCLFFFVKKGADYQQLVGDYLKNLPAIREETDRPMRVVLFAYGTESEQITAFRSVLTAMGLSETSEPQPERGELKIQVRDYEVFPMDSTGVLMGTLRMFSSVPTTEEALRSDQGYENATKLTVFEFVLGTSSDGG